MDVVSPSFAVLKIRALLRLESVSSMWCCRLRAGRIQLALQSLSVTTVRQAISGSRSTQGTSSFYFLLEEIGKVSPNLSAGVILVKGKARLHPGPLRQERERDESAFDCSGVRPRVLIFNRSGNPGRIDYNKSGEWFSLSWGEGWGEGGTTAQLNQWINRLRKHRPPV